MIYFDIVDSNAINHKSSVDTNTSTDAGTNADSNILNLTGYF